MDKKKIICALFTSRKMRGLREALLNIENLLSFITESSLIFKMRLYPGPFVFHAGSYFLVLLNTRIEARNFLMSLTSSGLFNLVKNKGLLTKRMNMTISSVILQKRTQLERRFKTSKTRWRNKKLVLSSVPHVVRIRSWGIPQMHER